MKLNSFLWTVLGNPIFHCVSSYAGFLLTTVFQTKSLKVFIKCIFLIGSFLSRIWSKCVLLITSFLCSETFCRHKLFLLPRVKSSSRNSATTRYVAFPSRAHAMCFQVKSIFFCYQIPNQITDPIQSEAQGASFLNVVGWALTCTAVSLCNNPTESILYLPMSNQCSKAPWISLHVQEPSGWKQVCSLISPLSWTVTELRNNYA